MTIVEHICERKYFYWATWEGWMNLFLLSYPKYCRSEEDLEKQPPPIKHLLSSKIFIFKYNISIL